MGKMSKQDCDRETVKDQCQAKSQNCEMRQMHGMSGGVLWSMPQMFESKSILEAPMFTKKMFK